MGLATTDGRSVLGTPEFMAPEMYEAGYSTSVDVYAFGMAVLEMISRAPPDAECTNPAQIFKRVMDGVEPAALARLASMAVARHASALDLGGVVLEGTIGALLACGAR